MGWGNSSVEVRKADKGSKFKMWDPGRRGGCDFWMKSAAREERNRECAPILRHQAHLKHSGCNWSARRHTDNYDGTVTEGVGQPKFGQQAAGGTCSSWLGAGQGGGGGGAFLRNVKSCRFA